MTSPIWSLSKLEALLKHGEPSVRKWAASRLSCLYAREIRHLLPRLLDDDEPEVVFEALGHLQRNPVEDLIPALGKLYLTGVEAVSSRTMQLLGDLRYQGAVDWMKKRILDPKPLGPTQIAAMIYALGRIESEDAYLLLKRTESAVREKDSSRWEMYYSALLQHKRAEDIATLLKIVEEEEEDKQRYRDALGLLLGEVDPGMNPSNVFFLSTSAVRKHWLRRLDELAGSGSPDDSPEVIGDLRELVLSVSPGPEATGELTAALNRMAMGMEGASPFEESVFRQGLSLLEKGAGTEGKCYAVMCLAVSSFLTVLEEKVSPPPRSDARTHQEKLGYLLRNRPPKRADEELMADVLQGAERDELIPILISALKDDPRNWGALRAVEMLGKLRAEEAIEAIIEAFRKVKDDLFVQSVRVALRDMGIECVPHLIPLLGSADLAERSFAMEILGRLPTREGVSALVDRSISLYAAGSSRLLNAMYEAGAEDFLPFLEKEYRPGEWELGRVYVHICLLNDLEPEGLREIRRDAVHGETLFEEHRRIRVGDESGRLSSISLELACRECGKKYHYEVTEVHLHPQEGAPGDEPDRDGGPYKNGVVVCDDLRCKNCRALNRMRLTPGALAEVTGESVRLLGLQRGGVRIPENHPVKHIRLDEREGKPLTLSDAEKEHLQALGVSPARPTTHLALGKFYEYVKEFRDARKFYLQALDLDSQALEAMAGLARLAHAEGNLEEATGWIEDCYSILDKGHLFLAEDAAAFKKTVRDKRREFARELGVKPKEKPVEIRFSMDVSRYPKNKPCPCGSGKKYKLCCMKGEAT